MLDTMQSRKVCSSWLCCSVTESRSQLEEALPQLSLLNRTRSRENEQDIVIKSEECSGLDDFGCLHHEKKKSKRKNAKDSYTQCQSVISKDSSACGKVKRSHKKVNRIKRKRKETICIDLKKALKSTKFIRIKSTKKMQIDIYKDDQDVSNRRSTKKKAKGNKCLKISSKSTKQMQIDIHKESSDSKNKSSNEKRTKNKRCPNISNKPTKKTQINVYKGKPDVKSFSEKRSKVKKRNQHLKFQIKSKHLVKLEKMILIVRKEKHSVNNKTKKNASDINSINLNMLKITADPEIDVDYVKGMSALTLYGTNYRNVIQENVIEDSVHFRPDLTEKIENLAISNVNNRSISTD